MPELTFAVTLLEESLLKTEGIHKSRGLKERLRGVRFIGRRFACLQMAAALLRGVRRARRSEGRQIRQLCPASAMGREGGATAGTAGDVVPGDAQWEVV